MDVFQKKKSPLLSAIPALKLVGIKLVSSGGLPKRKRPTGTVKQRRGAVTGTQVKGVRNSDYVVQRVKGFNQKARTQWQKSCAARGRQPQLQEHGLKWFAVGKGPRRQVRHTAWPSPLPPGDDVGLVKARTQGHQRSAVAGNCLGAPGGAQLFFVPGDFCRSWGHVSRCCFGSWGGPATPGAKKIKQCNITTLLRRGACPNCKTKFI